MRREGTGRRTIQEQVGSGMRHRAGPGGDAQVSDWLAELGIAGITDLHVHFMPDRVQQKVWGFFDEVAASGAPAWPIHYRLPLQERIEVLAGLGVRNFSSLNYAHRPGMAQWLNDFSTALAQDHAQVIHSATFFPEPQAPAVVQRALDAGARIFKIHVQVGGFCVLDPRLEEAWRLVEQAGAPVVIHCGHGPHPGTFTGIAPIRRLIERHPGLVLIIAHAGLPDYLPFAELAQKHSNVYLDTTMVGTSYMQQLFPVPPDYARILHGLAGKVVLGSDFPSIPYPYSHQLQVLNDWGLGAEWLAGALWHTPRELVGLPA